MDQTTAESWMREALLEAGKAQADNEVPIGAVLLINEKIVARAHNLSISTHDPTAHAELKALRQAAKNIKNYRLGGTLYVTLEPCLMCMGAIIHSRIERLVFGAPDPKTGAAMSVYRIGSDRRLNHTLSIEWGLLEEQCSGILRFFFKHRRRSP